ncbi:hypothetical protein SCLARK_001282 [Spiroplasma clarkii]|nr:hypothetical protein [Spiroplasma clarkii]ARU91822.1 hypothetical protein SCLARK_001282 [Spiroplasma clarkii]
MVGIGVDTGKVYHKKVENLKNIFNNTLYVGKAVSFSTKICNTMPFKNKKDKKNKYIGLGIEFFKQLKGENLKKFTTTKSKKKTVEKIDL